MKKKDKENIKLTLNKKFGRKKFFVLLALIFVIFALIGFSIFNKKEPLVADNYTIENDSVESISTVTGKGNLIEINPSQEEGKNKIEYVYNGEEDFQSVIDEYTKYLLEEKGFVKLESEDSKESDESSVSSYGMQSSEADKVFGITIAKDEKNYYITVFRYEGELPKEKEEEKKEFTRDDARSYLKNFIDETNELPLSFDSYTNIFDVGRSIINGEECYGMNIYQKGQSKCNEFVKKYYISLKEKNIYIYSPETGETVKIN